PVLELGAVEEPAAEHRDARPLGEVLAGAEDDQTLRFLGAVEDAPLRRRAAGAELDVDELDGVGLLLERARVRDRQVRPLDQLLELGAAGEAGDAEALDEDRVRA